MLATALAHRLILAFQAREAAAFRRGIPAAAAHQRVLLREYLAGHRRTALGRAHGLGGIGSYGEFARRVPILDYEAHRPFIDRAAAGEGGMLHPGRTLFLEETSGSSGGPKLIPYGRALRAEFQRGLSAWMDALSRQHPGAFRGKSYWSLSPALRAARRTSGGLPIGAEGDIGYFHPLKAPLLRAVLAVPDSLRSLRSAEEFYHATWVALLAAPSLTFLSCWSPLFLLQLDRFLLRNRGRIADGVRRAAAGSRAVRRLALLEGSFTWSDLWPELACVSCWTHGASAPWIDALRERLGPVPVQGKGLLSTECFVSFPWESGRDPVLAYRSHFFEFREMEGGVEGGVVPMEGLRPGGAYEVIATTGGGLCRYPTGDLVQVTSRISEVPCLRFLGRRNGWTDMAGEKVSEGAAVAAFQAARTRGFAGILGGALVACAGEGSRPRYRLHLEWRKEGGLPGAGELRDLAAAMEASLGENPYYRQARDLGQLDALEVESLDRGDMERLLAAYRRDRQAADGNVKLPFLFRQGEWRRLRGEHALAH